MRQRAARKRIVTVAFFPDAGVKDGVGMRRLALAGKWNDRAVGDLLPIQQQRIMRDSDHIADFRAVIHGDHAVIFSQRRTRKTAFFGMRIDGIGQILPVNQVIADGMPPVLARVFGRISLIEQMPASLPKAKPIGVVQGAFGIHIMIKRTMRVICQTLPRFMQTAQQWIGLKLRFLLVQALGKTVFWNA